jgi:RimJ/RimL family protein N-acetyltransferase
MTAARPDRSPLIGTAVRLDPLLESDFAALFAAIGHPEVFAGGYGGGPSGYTDDAEAFGEWARSYFPWQGGNVHAVRLVGGAHDGLLVGTTTLGDFDLALEHAHIGWTAYDPRVWGTAVNVEAKLLMLQAAFANGFGRVKLQADVLNDRSRGAIARLGATFEGVVRRDRRRADGSWRDSAVFSVIIDDWPEVRAGLEARLAAFGPHPVALRTADDGGSR